MNRNPASRTTLARSLAVLVVALGSAACILHGPGDLKRDLSQSAGVKLDREFGLTLGRTGTWVARKAMKWSGETDVSLKGVRKIEIGVYQVEGLRSGRAAASSLQPADLPDWSPLVRVHEEDSDVFVLLKEDDARIRGILVVVAEPDEWVLVRIRGRLDGLVEDVMQAAFDEVDRPDLYAATRRERGLEPAPASARGTPEIAVTCPEWARVDLLE